MEYIFIKGLDSTNGDAGVNKEVPRDGRPRIPASELPEDVRKNIAFNTLGYMKDTLNKLERSNYFGENDGLYLLNITPTVPIRVINLERRLDRWQSIDKALREKGIKHHTRFNAVDGTKIAMNNFIKNLFRNNDFNYRQGVVGCALSHIQLWQELLNSKDDYMVILEDDIELADDFESKLNVALHHMHQHPYIDLNFLGYFYWKGKPEKSNNYPEMKLINIPEYMGGFYGYVISKPCAMKLLHIMKFKGVQNGIDRFAHIHFNKMVVVNCEPHIVHSDYATGGNSKDSDIQRNHNPVGSLPSTPVLEKDKLTDVQPVDKSKIKVKPIYPYSNSKELCKYLNKFCKGNYTWNNIQLTDSNDADYFVIINKPGPPEYYDPKKTIIFHMEPWVYDESKPWGVKTWGKWASPNENVYYKVLTHKYHHNPLNWHLNKTFSELISYHPQKTKLLSTFVSAKNNDEGHIKRLEFLKYIENKDEVGDGIAVDIYGNGSKGYKNGKGFMEHKDDGMFPYKYTICVENNSERNYMTEKLADGILAECLCFYWGCPNVSDYIDTEAFIPINLDNFEEAYNTIKTAVENDEWSKRIDKIRSARIKVLNELSIMACIEKAIESKIPAKIPSSSETIVVSHPAKIPSSSETIITPILHAGFANQLFMIANAYATAKNNGMEFKLNKRYLGGRKPYFDTYFKNLKFEDLNLESYKKYNEPCHEYKPIEIQSKENTMLVGYYQSEKYFNSYKDDICKMFAAPEDIKNKAIQKFNFNEKVKVCVHIRRGDYVGSELHTVLPIEYYTKGKEYIESKIGKDISYLYFSDDKKWVKENITLNTSDIIVDIEIEDYEEFTLMQMCDHFIIANSSFSWWSAWLSKVNPNKIVIAPEQWFIGDKLNWKDIYCQDWIKF
jgi:GR25 family glycosyltransferase involved in LPS biosynthesis